jgi:hypothetical protein
LGYVNSGKSRSRRRNKIQHADGDSEDRPRLFSSYYKADQGRKKAQRESKKRRQQHSPMLQERDAPKKKRQQHFVISQQKGNTRIAELEATIRTTRIGIVIEHVCGRVFRDRGVGGHRVVVVEV